MSRQSRQQQRETMQRVILAVAEVERVPWARFIAPGLSDERHLRARRLALALCDHLNLPEDDIVKVFRCQGGTLEEAVALYRRLRRMRGRTSLAFHRKWKGLVNASRRGGDAATGVLEEEVAG